jgi:DNA modification methylase
LIELLNSHFAKPVLWAVRVLTTNFKMEVNKIYHNDWMNNNLADKSVQLIIADPPYYKVKGDFDFVWKTFDDYLKDVERWAIECKRVLADNGSLFWYGDRKNIAYAQVILDKYFNFENHIYWQKAEKCQMEMFDTLRSFYCRGYERILFYTNETANEDIENKEHYKPIIEKN